MHVVILKYCLAQLFNFATNPTCMQKPCVFFCKLRVVLKRTGWISEVTLKRTGLHQQVLGNMNRPLVNDFVKILSSSMNAKFTNTAVTCE